MGTLILFHRIVPDGYTHIAPCAGRLQINDNSEVATDERREW